jgi:hypothetical protein
MKKRNTKHEKRLKRLVITCLLCAIILSVSTYAWFIGMKTVSVNAFEVNIKTTESLMLSLDGQNWAFELDVNESKIDAYTGHQNSWGGDAGLIPMSSVGKIDTTKNKMTLFEKGSLTATDGGYRLLASEVTNTAAKEEDGYVAFDLFIRNLSGDAYYGTLGENEEGIYLTPDSQVTVADAGKVNAGIENSVRVAFAQIGRVQNYEDATGSDEDAKLVQGITCTDDSSKKITGICASRPATIWEPNDTKHVQNAINWYNESCNKRDEEGKYLGTACNEVKDGTHYETYAVAKEITAGGVDVYDGTAYNTYTGNIGATNSLYNVDTFTDSEKNAKGTARPEFFTLAPNSITKIRVYVYIEGQDVDNYDFASLGQAIKVSFGFTKERFYGEDVNYDQDPALPEGLQTRESAE